METPGEWLGAYRLIGRLGAGGMGEVFLGFDQRLQRTVALKRVRPDRGGGFAAERFRREARAVARLNHPNIVQIFDLLDDGAGGDWLVLEHVPGRSLAELLAAGPLPPAVAVPLAAQVAAGLAAAHERGLVHRDLKGDNVRVTDRGQAKILDFGLARSAEGPSDLTETGMVVGTYRAMSPEQARGEMVDFRSDLFSLGLLLYEVLAGCSPFAAESPLAGVSRLLREPAPPLPAGLPEGLARLVEELLDKDPARRPASAAAVERRLAALAPEMPEPESAVAWWAAHPAPPDERADEGLAETRVEAAAPPGFSSRRTPGAAPLVGAVRRRTSGVSGGSFAAVRWSRRVLVLGLAALAALIVALAGSRGWLPWERAEPLRVVVVGPSVAAGQPPPAELAVAGTLTATLRGLAALDGITAIDPSQIGEVRGPAVQVARAVAADEALVLSFEPGGNLGMKRVRAADGAIRWTETVPVPGAAEAMVLAHAVDAALSRAYPDHRARRGVPEIDARPEDYAEYLRIEERIGAGKSSWAPELGRLEGLLATSPRFLDAAIEAATQAINLYADSKRPEYLTRAEAALERARRLAADDPRLLAVEVRAALLAGDWARAERGVARLERASPGDVLVLLERSRLAEARGRLGDAIGFLRQVVARRPAWNYLLRLAELEVRRGEVAAARGHLEQLLARVPGHTWGLAKLGELELFYGDLKRAESIYRQLVAAGAQRSDLTNLGLVRFLLGDFAGAVASYRQALALDPEHWAAELNLADALSAAGEEGEARALYARVLAALEGRQKAAALSPVERTVVAQCLAHLGRRREAVAVAIDTLQGHPEDSEVAYQAALVFALAGENASALALTEKALNLGYQPRWFAIPAFADLRRSDPEFERALARAAQARSAAS